MQLADFGTRMEPKGLAAGTLLTLSDGFAPVKEPGTPPGFLANLICRILRAVSSSESSHEAHISEHLAHSA